MKTFAGFTLETGHITFYKFSDNNTNDIRTYIKMVSYPSTVTPFTSGDVAELSMGNGAAIFMNM